MYGRELKKISDVKKQHSYLRKLRTTVKIESTLWVEEEEEVEEEMVVWGPHSSWGGETTQLCEFCSTRCSWLVCSGFHCRSSRWADATRQVARFRRTPSSLDWCFLIDFGVQTFPFLCK